MEYDGDRIGWGRRERARIQILGASEIPRWRSRELNPHGLLARQVSVPTHIPEAGGEGIEPSSRVLEAPCVPYATTQSRCVRKSNSSQWRDKPSATPVASRSICLS